MCHEMIRTVSARWVFLLPNAIPLAPTENRKMKRVKELFQDVKWFAMMCYAVLFVHEKAEGGEA